MGNKLMKIAISLRLSQAQNYDEKRDALSCDWPIFLDKMNAIPLLIPNFSKNLEIFLKETEPTAIILSGGENIGEYPERDKTEQKLLEYGIENKLPIFGVCRGMQVINKYFGGALTKTNDKKHECKNHFIKLNNFSLFQNEEKILVNSFHENVIHKNELATDLTVLAKSEEDETIEAFIHKNYPIIGVMWHPEREQNDFNSKLVECVLKNDY